MKKELLLVAGAITFFTGFALATGVDENGWQAFSAIFMLCVSCLCFNKADRMITRENKALKEEIKKYRKAA